MKDKEKSHFTWEPIVWKAGNSYVITIPSFIVDSLKIKKGDTIKVVIEK